MALPASPSGPHYWKQEHKELLCVLSRFFKLAGSGKQESMLVKGAERILRRVFSGHWQASGSMNTPSISPEAVRSMLSQLQRTANPAWVRVFVDTNFGDRFSRWAGQRDVLTQAALGLGIRLCRRKSEHLKVRKQIADFRKSIPSSRVPTSFCAELPPMLSDPSAEPRPVDARPTASDDSAINWDTHRYYDHFASRYAFRVFTPSSHSINGPDGCLSGNCTNAQNVVDPERSSELYMGSAYNHLSPKDVRSNFLSISTSLRASVRHGLRRSRKEPAWIAIIEMEAIANASTSASRLTPSSAIVKRIPGFQGFLRHRRDDDAEEFDSTPMRSKQGYAWKCSSEWLVWQYIPANAIIKVVSIDDLLKFLIANPTVDETLHINALGRFDSASEAREFLAEQKIILCRPVGKTVGEFLCFLGLDIAQRGTERLIGSIKYAWRIERYTSTPQHSRRYNPAVNNAVFMHGVLQGFIHGAPKARQAAQSNQTGLMSFQVEEPMAIDGPVEEKEESDDEVARVHTDNDKSPCPSNFLSKSIFIDLTADEVDDQESRTTMAGENTMSGVQQKPARLDTAMQSLQLARFRLGQD